MRRDQEALMIWNRHAGKSSERSRIPDVLDHLREHGWRVDIRETSQPGDASAFTRDAVAHGLSMVIAAGGDGTVNEVIQGLANTGVVLGILPLGTGNRSAVQMGIPTEIQAAAQVLTHGYVRLVDLGEVEGRYFLFGAGVGFDALVAQQTSSVMKKLLGISSYGLAAFLATFYYNGSETTLVTPDNRSCGPMLQVTVGNGRPYTERMVVTPEAQIDDGLLDVCVFKGQGRSAVFRHVLNVLSQRHLLDAEVEYYRVPQLSICCKKEQPVQVDGEVLGTTPVTFKVVPRSLRVLVPGPENGN